VAQPFSKVCRGCPSIRTKALSSNTYLVQCFSHRVVARERRTKNSGNLAVSHFSMNPSTDHHESPGRDYRICIPDRSGMSLPD